MILNQGRSWLVLAAIGVAAVVLVGFLLLWPAGLAQAQSGDSGIPDDIPSITGIEITSTSDDTRLTGDDDENTIYIKHDQVEVTVSFSRDVTVTGTPHLGLEIGGLNPYLGVDPGANTRYAEYESVSGSEVVFTYTVVASDLDADGIGIAADALGLNGGTIQDACGNAANPTHSAFSYTNHLVVGFWTTGPWTYRA